MSHDALYNIYELCLQLNMTNRKGDSKDFITRISIHPRTIVHIMAHPLLDSLEHLLNVSTDPVCYTMIQFSTWGIITCLH